MLVVHSVSAQSLSSWTFNSNNRAAEGVAEHVSADDSVAAGPFGGSLAITANSSIRGVGDTGYLQTWQADDIYASEAEALTNSTYFTFTVTPDSGYELNISEISFYGWVSTAGPYNGGDYNYFVRSSETGTTTLGTYTNDVEVASNTVPTTANQFMLDLSGESSLQGLTDSVTFTIGVYTATKPTAGYMRMDSIAIGGTATAIPESSTWALAASVFVLFMFFARRLRRR